MEGSGWSVLFGGNRLDRCGLISGIAIIITLYIELWARIGTTCTADEATINWPGSYYHSMLRSQLANGTPFEVQSGKAPAAKSHWSPDAGIKVQTKCGSHESSVNPQESYF